MLFYYALKLAGPLVSRVPARIAYLLADFAGTVAWALHPRGRKAAAENLKHVLGPPADKSELRSLVRKVFRSAARNYFDLLQLPRLSAKQLRQLISVEGDENFVSALESGRGVILVTAHLGNFDIAVQYARLRDCQVIVLVEPLHPPRMFMLMAELRSSKGIRFIPVGSNSLKEIVRTLDQGGVVGIANDRDIQHNGMRVRFFDAETTLPAGAATLAVRTGALILPAFCKRAPDGKLLIQVEPAFDPRQSNDPEVDIRRCVEQIGTIMEQYIRASPDQWVVFDPIWKQNFHTQNSLKTDPPTSLPSAS